MKWGLRAPSPAECSSSMKVKLWKAVHRTRYSKIQKKIVPSYFFPKFFHIKSKESVNRRLFFMLENLCIELASHFTIYPNRVMSCGESAKIQIRLKWF